MSHRSLRAVYAIPGVLLLVSIAGLLSALLGDGLFDGLSWLALGGLAAVVVWALTARRQS